MQLGKLSSDSNQYTVTVELGEVPIRHMMNLYNLPEVEDDNKDIYKRLVGNIVQFVGSEYLNIITVDLDRFIFTFEVNQVFKSQFTNVAAWISTYLSVRAGIPMQPQEIMRGSNQSGFGANAKRGDVVRG